MIICFYDKINSFSKFNKKSFSLTQDDVQDLMPSCEDINCKCPNCKAKNNFSYHASYVRNISFAFENKFYDFKVTVTRVICNSCGSTHALLPDFVVPYKIFSRQAILYIVSKTCSSSVLKMANKLNISIQLIYSLISIVLSFFSFVDSLNREKNLYKSFDKTYFTLNCLNICDENFDIEFFNCYNWVFLMTKCRDIGSPPFTIGVNLIAST